VSGVARFFQRLTFVKSSFRCSEYIRGGMRGLQGCSVRQGNEVVNCHFSSLNDFFSSFFLKLNAAAVTLSPLWECLKLESESRRTTRSSRCSVHSKWCPAPGILKVKARVDVTRICAELQSAYLQL